jgi:cytochrome c peroxidase
MTSASSIRWVALGVVVLVLALVTSGLLSRSSTAAEDQKLPAAKAPLGLDPVPVPNDNPMTAEKVELGRMLYFDTRLSADGKVSCATCHDPKQGWAERKPTSTGIKGQVGGRNAPTVINAAYARAQFWDGRAASLEEQALGPVQNPIEMGNTLPAMIADLSKVAAYRAKFQRVFGSDVTKEGVAKAIAAFERTILSGNSPYDRFKAGEKAALDASQKRGMALFEKSGCADCHSGSMFSDYGYYNAGVGCDKGRPDSGRMSVTKNKDDEGKFRVPSLREVANTAPYFHDGSAATLAEAVELMASGGKKNPNLSDGFEGVRDAKLTAQDRTDLVNFLKALSGEYPIVEAPKLP